jgi:hypothetical protein
MNEALKLAEEAKQMIRDLIGFALSDDASLHALGPVAEETIDSLAALAQEAQPDSHEKECEQAYASGLEFGKQIGRAEAQQEAQGETGAWQYEWVDRPGKWFPVGIEDNLAAMRTSKMMRLRPLYTHPAPVAVAPQVPAGWKIKREPTGELVISGPGVGVVVRENPTKLRLIPEEALYMLAMDLLAASPQPTKGGV